MHPHPVAMRAVAAHDCHVNVRFSGGEAPQASRRGVAQHCAAPASEERRGLSRERRRNRVTDQVDVLMEPVQATRGHSMSDRAPTKSGLRELLPVDHAPLRTRRARNFQVPTPSVHFLWHVTPHQTWLRFCTPGVR